MLPLGIVLEGGSPREGEMLPASGLPPSHLGVIFGHFFALFFQVCFWRHIFRTFYAFGVPRVSQIGVFWVNFETLFRDWVN